MQTQYWNLYDDMEAYQKNSTEAEKRRLYQDFDNGITTQVDYPDLQRVLGQLMVVREELLLVLEYPWLPLHNNLSERQIRESVKRRKVSGGTRSALGRKCHDTFDLCQSEKDLQTAWDLFRQISQRQALRC